MVAAVAETTPHFSIITDDARKLFRDFGITGSGLVELGAFAQHADPSFAKTCNELFKCQIRVSHFIIVLRFKYNFFYNYVRQRSIISLEKVVCMYTGRRCVTRVLFFLSKPADGISSDAFIVPIKIIEG
jgi:hypothetical protein